VASPHRLLCHRLGKGAMAIAATCGKGGGRSHPLAAGRQGSLSWPLPERSGDGIAQKAVKFSELNTLLPRQNRSPKKGSPGGAHKGFSEINRGLSGSALFEAKRCFNCGVCNLCDNASSSARLAISRPDSSYEINYDYCKVLLCVRMPRGAISIE